MHHAWRSTLRTKKLHEQITEHIHTYVKKQAPSEEQLIEVKSNWIIET